MRIFLIIVFIAATLPGIAQHCPWDCSGMVLVETNLAPKQMEQAHLMVTGENKKPVIDTFSNEGKPFYDTCRLYPYAEFLKKRKEQLKTYRWYQYDTVYHFAENKYLVRFNLCRFYGKKLFLSFQHPYTRNLQIIYIEIPDNKRISLHAISDKLYKRDYEAISKEIAPMIMRLDCKELLRRDCDGND
jgi:hypothetical protein